eukprot:GHVS01068376.1.p1 GENE.GHVS01068376.1~~GHVS01068376.1.p1  ORF type:complete len:200 (+),score=52.40 GHVS01068376.1:33-632(+)
MPPPPPPPYGQSFSRYKTVHNEKSSFKWFPNRSMMQTHAATACLTGGVFMFSYFFFQSLERAGEENNSRHYYLRKQKQNQNKTYNTNNTTTTAGGGIQQQYGHTTTDVTNRSSTLSVGAEVTPHNYQHHIKDFTSVGSGPTVMDETEQQLLYSRRESLARRLIQGERSLLMLSARPPQLLQVTDPMNMGTTPDDYPDIS